MPEPAPTPAGSLSVVTRAERLYAAHAVDGLVAHRELVRLCDDHTDLAPVLRQVDFVQRLLQGPTSAQMPVVAGYRIERQIGSGGMGAVFAAHHDKLDRLVALKLIHDAWAGDGGAQQRFLREARAMAQLTHRHIVPIYDVVADDARLALAMELIAGADLAAVADCLGRARTDGGPAPARLADLLGDAGDGPWPGAVPFLVTLANEVAQALSAVHAAGLLHRDVKPSNVRVRAHERSAVLLDFGVARGRDEVTHSPGFVGTPGFASPEQLAGSDLDERTDLYALGQTLRACLRTALGLGADAPGPLRPRCPEVSSDLDAVLAKALEPDRRDRYQSASALARDLAAVRDGRPVSARPRGRLRRGVHWVTRDRTRLLLAATALLLIVVAGVLWSQWPRVLAARAREHRAAVERALAHAHRLLLDPLRREDAPAAFASVRALAPASDEATLGAVAAAVLLRRDAQAEALLAEHPRLRRLEPELTHLRAEVPEPAPAAAIDPTELRLVTMLRYLRALRTNLADDFAAATAALQRLRWCEGEARELHYGLTAYAAIQASRATAHRDLRAVADHAVTGLRTLWPESGSAHAWIALACREVDPKAARAAAAAAMGFEPSLKPYLQPLAIGALADAGEPAAAAAELTEALVAEPRSPALHLLRGDFAAAGGDAASALAAYQTALTLRPDSLPALAKVAAAVWQSDRAAAAPYLERLTELSPFLPQPYQNLGRLHFSAKDFAAAHAALERAVALDAGDGVSMCMLGECRFHLQRDDALTTLQAAADLLPDSARPHYFLARELHRRGDLDRALAAARTALRLLQAGDASVRLESARTAVEQLQRLLDRR